MSGASQKRALKTYRERLSQKGLARYEVLGLDVDRDLIRALARRLAENGADSGRIRAAMNHTIGNEAPRKGGILAALRRSPLVGADLQIERSATPDRKLDL